MQGLTKEMMAEMTPESLRGMMDSWDVSTKPAYSKWNKEASYVRKSLGGKRYHPNAKRTYAYLHTKNGLENAQDMKCMLFYHGGGAVAGNPE